MQTDSTPSSAPARLWKWVDQNVVGVVRQVRVDYLPPLMVYAAAGISGLTAIVGTFFTKEYLGLSAEFLAMLGFWAGIPWVLKMPLGHLVDLIWRWKSWLVGVGAALIAASLLIMLALIRSAATGMPYMSVEAWYVLSTLLAPVGYVVQDVVADAMTVEAVPKVDAEGRFHDERELKQMHTTMQMLGRMAIVGGGISVALVNIVLFRGVGGMSEAEQVATYADIYSLALLIPVMSVLGVALAAVLRRVRRSRLQRQGFSPEEIGRLLDTQEERPRANWWLLGGSLVFVIFTLGMGLSRVPYDQEIIFAGSMAIVVVLMMKLVQGLTPAARRTLVGTAVVIFVYRALPGPGAGYTWWEIDDLGFDQQFIAKLSLIASSLALCGMLVFRRFMVEKSIAYVVGFLTIVGTLLTLPNVGMYYGLHNWTAAHSNGIVDARFIAVIDLALEAPFGQVAMIPMLAWIANSAPSHLKATFFAVMASFANLALSLSQLGTKYANQIFTITREVRDAVTDAVTTPADYSELGILLITLTAFNLLLPFLAILVVRSSRLRSA